MNQRASIGGWNARRTGSLWLQGRRASADPRVGYARGDASGVVRSGRAERGARTRRRKGDRRRGRHHPRLHPDRGRPPPAGQNNLAAPFFLRLDDSGKPVRFEGGTLPARIPFQVSKIEPAVGAGVRVGAIIHYLAKDAQHEMYTALAIMQDGNYRIGVMLKVPPQTTAALTFSAHGSCVAKPA
jgi:hypothetical protein